MAQRILGMGDVLTLVEKAERQMDERKAAELERKIRKQQFTLDDFLDQMHQIRKMGPLTSLLKMMPGVGSQLGNLKVDDRDLDRLHRSSRDDARRRRNTAIRTARGAGSRSDRGPTSRP